MPYVIAVDLGTTHCKILVVDEQGKPHHSFKAGVVSYQPGNGLHEQDAAAIYKTVIKLLRQTFSATGTENIAAICFSAGMHSLLAVDENGEALTPVITWADTRSRSYARELRKTGLAQRLHMQTGTPIHAMSPLCKLLWLRDNQPEIFARTHKFVSVKEYILFHLCGKYIVDEGIASSTGLYDIYHHRWYADALELAGITTAKLSLPVPATHREELQSSAKNILGVTTTVPLVAGGNDGSLANLGCGVLQPDLAVITTGTSGAVRATIKNPLKSAHQGLFRYILSDDYYVTGGGTNNGGVVLQWFADNFINSGVSDNISSALHLATTVPAGSEGLVFLPYLLGERAPVWDETAAGVFFGVKMLHGKAHFARAVIEGISFSLVQVLYALEQANGPVKHIYASGAITQSAWWMQLLADMSGREVVFQEAADASALGAAIIGMYATGIISDLRQSQQFFSGGTVFIPDENLHTVYRERYKIFTSLYPQLKDLF